MTAYSRGPQRYAHTNSGFIFDEREIDDSNTPPITRSICNTIIIIITNYLLTRVVHGIIFEFYTIIIEYRNSIVYSAFALSL